MTSWDVIPGCHPGMSFLRPKAALEHGSPFFSRRPHENMGRHFNHWDGASLDFEGKPSEIFAVPSGVLDPEHPISLAPPFLRL